MLELLVSSAMTDSSSGFANESSGLFGSLCNDSEVSSFTLNRAITVRLAEKKMGSKRQFTDARANLDTIPSVEHDDLSLGRELGRGSFGTVMKIKSESDVFSSCTGKEMVAKKLSRSSRSLKKRGGRTKRILRAARDMMIEATILGSLDHPNVISLRAVSPSCDILVVDRLEETLTDRIQHWKRKTKLHAFMPSRKEKQSQLLIKQMNVLSDLASALTYLHGQHVMHRDLKPDNIGFDAQGTLKVFDFGLSSFFDERETPFHHTAAVGTYRYMAPENFLGEPYDERTDVYSMGLVLWEMLHFKAPFEGHNVNSFRELVCLRGHRPDVDGRKVSSDCVVGLLKACWCANPQERPRALSIGLTADEIVQSLRSSAGAEKGGRLIGESTYKKRLSVATVQTVSSLEL